jgi:hypothetical protein
MPKLPFTVLAAVAGLVLAQPVAAQDSTPATQAAPDGARLAAAKITIDYILPAGTYGKMFGGSFNQLMDQTVDSMTNIPMADLMRSTGLPPEDVAKLGRATLADVMEIMDPAYRERQKATMEAMAPALNKMMASMEPAMREAMADAYAKHFTLEQLNDMNRFFATPSGMAYANNSMLIMMDPEVIGRVSKDTPKMIQEFMAQMPEIQKRVQAMTANLPKPRDYKDLTPEQKAKLANLLGIDEKDLDKGSAASGGKAASRRSSRH